MCGVHTNAEAAKKTKGTTGCEDAARPADNRRAWRNDSGRRGAATPLPVPGAELSARRRGRRHGERGDGRARSPAPPCSALSARPHSRGGGPRCRDGRRKPALSADVDTRPLAAKTGKLDNVAPGQRLGHGHSVASYSLSGTRGQKKRPHRPLTNTDTARPRHASLYTFKSSGSRTRSGPATSPPSTDSGGLAKPRSLARWYRGGETNALNGDPGAWLRSHRRSGAEDPLPARSEAPRMEELGEMLVDPSDQPPHVIPAAPVHLPRYCRSNLQLEQACPDLRNTGIVAASDAGLWSSAPCSLAESQPL